MSFLLGIIYLSFISLGLPDALLGAAWPNMYLDFQVPVSFAGMFCIGITIGRGINGFLAMKLKDRQMIRMGQSIILTGIIVMILPLGEIASLIGFSLIGLGASPLPTAKFI